jgi:2,3-bisphosphoglycerate-dependent phosphoglycerate mutase
MRTVYIIRHAQSANNALPDWERVPDPGLTELGVRQADQLAHHACTLPIHRLYCSPFLRSLQTAMPLGKAINQPLHVNRHLYEVKGCFSGYQVGKLLASPGLGRSQILKDFDPCHVDESIQEQGWNFGCSVESDEEANERARRVAKWIIDDQAFPSQQHIAMVIHADFIVKLLIAMTEALSYSNQKQPWLECDPYNASITKVTLHDDMIGDIDYNDIHHLQGMISV